MSKEEKYINLSFDKTVSRLAGFAYGQEIFQKQVKEQIDYQGITHIVFPDSIIKIASSFVQGFFDEIIAKVGMDAIGRTIIISTQNPDLKESILNNLI